MNIKKYFLLSSVALLAVACQDDKPEVKVPTANPGDDVVFGAQVEENAVSRTIYGDEVGKGTDHDYFDLFWLKDDQMFIASPQCMISTADYGVNPEAFKEGNDTSAYAGKLLRVSEAGIQWGTATTADFYSIYPQRSGNYKVTTADGYSAANPVFSLNMPNVQTCKVAGNVPVMTTADMYACFMYAKAMNEVRSNDPINLRYKPISTAIRFTIKANEGVSTIAKIELTCTNQKIAGPFTVNLSDETDLQVTPGANAVNTITIFASYASGSNLRLSNGQSIELNAFIIPQKNLKIDENWSLKIYLSDGAIYTKNLNGTATSGHTMNLKPGKIHRLPDLPQIKPGTWRNDNWMENIPRNVYLSEISIPGSWSSLNSNYQSGINFISDQTDSQGKVTLGQYSIGCRAFHLDTRYRGNNSGSGTITDVGIANGTNSWSKDGKEVMYESDTQNVQYYLNQIAQKSSDKEYIIVYCTFGLNSYRPTDRNWVQDVSTACGNITKVLDARSFNSTFYYNENDPETYKYKEMKLNQNTTVGDVLGKIIVVCGVDDDEFSKLPSNSKCLFVKMSLTREKADYPQNATAAQTFFTTDELYYCDGTPVGISFNNSITQITLTNTGLYDHGWGGEAAFIDRGYVPPFRARNAVTNNILTWASAHASERMSNHNHWIFLGLGGYRILTLASLGVLTQDSYNDVTEDQNKVINDKLNAMAPAGGTPSYYPVGTCLINRLGNDTYGSQTLVTTILQLNSKFHMAYDPNKAAF